MLSIRKIMSSYIASGRGILNLEMDRDYVARLHNLVRGSLFGALAILLSVLATGCETEFKEPQLRVSNDSSTSIENLSVIFPEDQIYFGDIAPGATTDYIVVPNGVYRYAAYEFDLNGQRITQPVIDWVGETPLEGNLFTFTINIDPNRNDWQIIQLIEVTKD